ncbi:MAG: efflux RND transporter periplasmic adaptor subunit [Bryobacteraceae bacterium]|nr:efflux RND transporter periplasmic adaptor subunit [Bryobacteraceae bacterium]MDW8376593.1 efflux RND transporter periplasmic adaptor subunit [Bryobacterales bacterium]
MNFRRTALTAALLSIAFILGLSLGRRQAVHLPEAHQQEANYYCPMHPQVRSEKPGNCPICGMRLVQQEVASVAGQSAAETLSLPAGSFRVPLEKQQLIGVTYDTARLTLFSKSVRSTGRVAVDETRIRKVQTRLEGWVEHVYAAVTGKFVAQGEPLLSISSPELLALQQEYLLALRSEKILASSPLVSGNPHPRQMIAAARRRLEFFELSPEQLEQVARTQQPIPHFLVSAPQSGYILERKVFPKQRVTPDSELYTLADLSRVWVIADLFEAEALLVGTGSLARITSASRGQWNGRVAQIQPQVDAETRTVKVRIEVDNRNGALKPDLFVDVDFYINLGMRLSVASEAVLDTGLRKTVFVDLGDGYLQPRAVVTGEQAEGRTEILSGLQAGERVVASGAFLIDSESQLNASRSQVADGAAQQAGRLPAGNPPTSQASPHKHD